MTDLIHQLVDWVAAHPHWTGFFVFLIALAESLAIVGMVVPGVVMMFAAGALIGAGAVGFWSMYWLAFAGAVIGDGLSFWLGYRLRGRVAGLWPFTRHPESLQRGVAFFDRYGGKSVAFGRFFGPVRAVIPLVAGMLSMAPVRFFVANVLSALLWALAYLAPGVAFGASLELASEVAVRLVLLLLVLVSGLWFIVWVGHRLFRRVQPLASRLVQWLLTGEQWPAFSRRIAAALADPSHPEARGLAVLAGLLVVAMALFAFMLTAVLGATPLAGVDRAVFEALSSLRTPGADHVMVFLTAFGDGWWTSVVAVLVFTVLLTTDRRSAWYWLAATAFAFAAPALLKVLLQLPRPFVADGLSPWGFPSAHATRAVVVYGFLAVMASSLLRPERRWSVYWVSVVVVALVGFSRLYLGVHWLSDVIGGVLLGALWVAALGIAYRHHPHGYPRGPRLASALFLALVVGVAVQSGFRQTPQVERYAIPREQVTATRAAWLAGDLALPVERDDLMARLHQPLNIQYAGALHDLLALLEADGWVRPEKAGWKNLLRLLSPSLPLNELPILPQVHDGRHEAIVVARDGVAGRRLALRLWPSDLTVTPEGAALWLGNIGVLERAVLLDLIAYPRVVEVLEAPLDALPLRLREAATMSDGVLRLQSPGAER